MPSPTEGFLGIDIGTQGLSVLFCSNEDELRVLATGEGSYDFVTSEGEQKQGWYEQQSSDWLDALRDAMKQVHQQLPGEAKILAVGISGQMHGEVLMDDDGTLEPVRLWCDSRNQEEGTELTDLFQVKVPKRSTCARFLWTSRNRFSKAQQTRYITTPAGFVGFALTGEHTLGSGDAAGMFPVNPQTGDYDTNLLKEYNKLLDRANSGASDKSNNIQSFEKLLPRLCCAGEDAGFLNAEGAELLGIPFDATTKIPVAGGEGDQVAALAGSLIGNAGTISCSFGTSVCANVVAKPNQIFEGVSPAVDHFTDANGLPIHMVWLRNGTTFLNTIVESYGSMLSTSKSDEKQSTNADDTTSLAFAKIMPALIKAPPDCGGLLALPFEDDEPGLGVTHGGSALIMGWNSRNREPGYVAKAALLSTIFNLKSGCQILERKGSVEMNEVVLSGGLVKTPQCGQIVADIFNLPVTLLQAAEEGCSWGASVLAQYRYLCLTETAPVDWGTFLEDKKKIVATSVKDKGTENTRFIPNENAVQTYNKMYQRYQELMKVEQQLRRIVAM